METYESTVHRLHGTQAEAYAKLADLRNLEQIREKYKQTLPPEQYEKIKNFTCDEDSCSVNVAPVGDVTLRIVEREPNKTIKFGADRIPFAFNAWIQLKENSLGETLVRVTVKADLPFFVRKMAGDKLQYGVERIAQTIAAVL